MTVTVIPGNPTPMIRIIEANNYVDLRPDELLDLQRQLMRASYEIHKDKHGSSLD